MNNCCLFVFSLKILTLLIFNAFINTLILQPYQLGNNMSFISLLHAWVISFHRCRYPLYAVEGSRQSTCRQLISSNTFIRLTMQTTVFMI